MRARFDLRLPSLPVSVGVANAAAAEVGRAAGLDPLAVEALVLAVGEVTANAVLHGNGGRVEQPVTMRMRVVPGAVVVRIHDRGSGFPGHLLAAGTGPESPDLLRPGGRGLLLARACVDRLGAGPTGRGYRVSLIKRCGGA